MKWERLRNYIIIILIILIIYYIVSKECIKDHFQGLKIERGICINNNSLLGKKTKLK